MPGFDWIKRLLPKLGVSESIREHFLGLDGQAPPSDRVDWGDDDYHDYEDVSVQELLERFDGDLVKALDAKGMDLEQDEHGEVTRISIPGGDPTDEEFALLARFSNLKRLYIKAYTMSNSAFESLSEMPQIEGLFVCGNDEFQITDETLGWLSSLNRLRKFELSGCRVSGVGLVHINNPGQLDCLDLSSTLLNDDTIDVIKRFPNLTNLSLWETKVTDAGLRHLLSCDSLQSIDLASTRVTDKGIQLLIELQELQSLSLHNTRCTDGCKDSLLRLPKLKEVEFGDDQVSPSTVEQLLGKGVNVRHGTLVGFRRENNFLRYLDVDFQVDTNESSLVAYLNPGRDNVTWQLNIKCTNEYIPSHMQTAYLEGPPFVSQKGWRDLAGEEFRRDFDEESVFPLMPGNPGNIYVGWHAVPNDHIIRFTERNKNGFLVEWNCEAKEDRDSTPQPIQVSAEIPFTQLIVWSDNPLTLTDAKKLASCYFDLSDFKPEVVRSVFGYRFHYTLRDDVV